MDHKKCFEKFEERVAGKERHQNFIICLCGQKKEKRKKMSLTVKN